MTVNIEGTLDSVVSHAMTLGIFERVNAHEPKNSPGNGLSAAVWVDYIGSVAAGSGLSSTSARLVFNVRIYTNMLSDPQDAIDPAMVKAVDLLMNEYSGDFDLGGNVRNVDLLGQSGTGLEAKAGYLNQDGKNFRVMTITLPVVLNDAWDQVS